MSEKIPSIFRLSLRFLPEFCCSEIYFDVALETSASSSFLLKLKPSEDDSGTLSLTSADESTLVEIRELVISFSLLCSCEVEDAVWLPSLPFPEAKQVQI